MKYTLNQPKEMYVKQISMIGNYDVLKLPNHHQTCLKAQQWYELWLIFRTLWRSISVMIKKKSWPDDFNQTYMKEQVES